MNANPQFTAEQLQAAEINTLRRKQMEQILIRDGWDLVNWKPPAGIPTHGWPGPRVTPLEREAIRNSTPTESKPAVRRNRFWRQARRRGGAR